MLNNQKAYQLSSFIRGTRFFSRLLRNSTALLIRAQQAAAAVVAAPGGRKYSFAAAEATIRDCALLHNQQHTFLRRQINVNAVRQSFGIP